MISPSTDSPFNHPDHGASFHWLVPAARAELARRVVLVGAESTGKSTLARALAEAFETVRVPEHGRWYWEGRRYLEDQTWTNEEFRRIAAAQRLLEHDLSRRAVHGIVIADTDPLVTRGVARTLPRHARPRARDDRAGGRSRPLPGVLP